MASFSVGLEIACLLALGVLARKLKLVTPDFAGGLSRIVLSISIPCVIIKALIKPITDEQLHAIPMTLVCVAIYLIFAILLTRLFARKRDDRSTIITASTLFPNFTFMGYPVIEAFYGSEGILSLSILTIPIRILLYSIMPMLFPKDKNRKSLLSSLKALCVPAVFAIPIGIALNLMHAGLPVWLSNVVSTMASTSTPLGMMICGILIADVDIKSIISDKDAITAAFIRLILLPALTLAGLYFLPISRVSRDVMVTFAALPSATITTAYAVNSGTSPRKAATIVTFSTIASIVTLPVWALILSAI